jgi:hypothetical protein
MPDDASRLILIVVGTELRAEEADRPLAYYLRGQVLQALADRGEAEEAAVFVVADLRWLSDPTLQAHPTISLGGPGVNHLARRWIDDPPIPISLAVDNEYYIQMDPELDELHASLWGMDNPSTQIAVNAFVQRFLPAFLDGCQKAGIEPDDD